MMILLCVERIFSILKADEEDHAINVAEHVLVLENALKTRFLKENIYNNIFHNMHHNELNI